MITGIEAQLPSAVYPCLSDRTAPSSFEEQGNDLQACSPEVSAQVGAAVPAAIPRSMAWMPSAAHRDLTPPSLKKEGWGGFCRSGVRCADPCRSGGLRRDPQVYGTDAGSSPSAIFQLDKYIYFDILAGMKPIVFLGDSLGELRAFPDAVRHEAGFQLDKVQRGMMPDDFKPLSTVGKGVQEIRLRDASGAYRIIYIAKLEDAVYVLHAFKKKTQRASKADIELAKRRLAELVRK